MNEDKKNNSLTYLWNTQIRDLWEVAINRLRNSETIFDIPSVLYICIQITQIGKLKISNVINLLKPMNLLKKIITMVSEFKAIVKDNRKRTLFTAF